MRFEIVSHRPADPLVHVRECIRPRIAGSAACGWDVVAIRLLVLIADECVPSRVRITLGKRRRRNQKHYNRSREESYRKGTTTGRGFEYHGILRMCSLANEATRCLWGK